MCSGGGSFAVSSCLSKTYIVNFHTARADVEALPEIRWKPGTSSEKSRELPGKLVAVQGFEPRTQRI